MDSQRLRRWLLDMVTEVEVNHQLIYLNLSDEKCLSQIAKRRIETPERFALDTKEVFEHVILFFEAFTESEGIRTAEEN